MTQAVQYPTVDEILAIHEDIVEGDPRSEPGVRSRGTIESALTYVSSGYFGMAPRTVHEKAAHLLRLLVAEHPFVDGNKRTALNTVVLFYNLNGYEFQYDDRIRQLLRSFATDASTVDVTDVARYCREHATRPKDKYE